jgi:hypothetical protein
MLTYWGDPDVDGRIILRWIIFRKWEGFVGTGWSWLRTGTGADLGVPTANDCRGVSVWAKLLIATVVAPSAIAAVLRCLMYCIHICQKCCILYNMLSANRKVQLACVCIPRWCRGLNTCVPHSRLAFLFRIIFQGSSSLATPSTESTVTSCKDIHYICSVFSFMLSPCSVYRHLCKNQLTLNARKQGYTSQCAQWCYVNYTGRTESVCPCAIRFCFPS